MLSAVGDREGRWGKEVSRRKRVREGREGKEGVHDCIIHEHEIHAWPTHATFGMSCRVGTISQCTMVRDNTEGRESEYLTATNIAVTTANAMLMILS